MRVEHFKAQTWEDLQEQINAWLELMEQPGPKQTGIASMNYIINSNNFYCSIQYMQVSKLQQNLKIN